NRRQHDEPQQAPLCLPLRDGADAEEGRDQAEPIAPEISEERDRGAEMKDHEEWQEAAAGLIDVPAKERWQDDGMAETAHRKKLGHALKDRHDERLQRVHSTSNPFSTISVCHPS